MVECKAGEFSDQIVIEDDQTYQREHRGFVRVLNDSTSCLTVILTRLRSVVASQMTQISSVVGMICTHCCSERNAGCFI